MSGFKEGYDFSAHILGIILFVILSAKLSRSAVMTFYPRVANIKSLREFLKIFNKVLYLKIS